MDTKLRDIIRAHRQGSASREEVLRALARSGITPDAVRDEVHAGLHRVLDALDYTHLRRTLDATDGAAAFAVGASSLFTAMRGAPFAWKDGISIRAWWPSEDEVVTGAVDDVRFVVDAPLRERTPIIDAIQNEFPRAAVVSSAVARRFGNVRPDRPNGPVDVEALWPEESKRVHVRGK